ncbi:hypothetical protein [Bradyrhizobium sp. JYMT SZCCT0428]|uniref:hypothetical protein n=1 Tax=Bradyrhizobium sp. JYMT SZCCT0428 TaxID=2807673 RepID=UPI001BAAFBC0|nr:hypothetical protein [Bradyrhizobium sp. JYMT SZCCT0428]MBR1156022.1 hypothetical protein [Bradyrhizobium sp. JYMT SZCCT0428]
MPRPLLVRSEVGNELRSIRPARAYLAALVVGAILSVSSFYAGTLWERGADLSPADLPSIAEADHSEEITLATPLLDAIFQNTPGQSEGYAVGVPRGFAWCGGWYKPAGDSPPPSNFTAVTAKGQIYPKEGARAFSGKDGITIRNAKTYVHLSTTREWVLVQDQATDEITGAHFVADFSPNAGKPMKLSSQPDRSVVISAPPAGYNDHFWPAQRGKYAAGSVDGVYVQMDMRTNDPNMKFVASVGADWWLDASAGVLSDVVTVSGAGQSNWVELSTRWSTLRFYSWSIAQLQADPPPPLADSAIEEKAAIIRRRTNASSPCLSVPQERARS